MTRWNPGCKNPKHLQIVDGETLLQRLVRQLRGTSENAKIIITSHDERYEVQGAERYEPMNNKLEIDRFTWELIEDDLCFLYGDTYYTDEAIKHICAAEGRELLFFGAEDAIVAVSVFNAAVMKAHVSKVREEYLAGRLKNCKGWQVYYSFMDSEAGAQDQTSCFIQLKDGTRGFNTVEEYNAFIQAR